MQVEGELICGESVAARSANRHSTELKWAEAMAMIALIFGVVVCRKVTKMRVAP
jgi:hypothetical protein